MTDGSIHIEIKDSIFLQIKELNAKFNSLEKSVKGIEANSKSSFSSIGASLKNISFVSFTQGIQNVSQGLKDLNAPGLAFNSSMADLQAITGLSGKALDVIGEKARINAKEFGGNAAKSLETYKLLLSQLTPELAKQPKVLDAMAKNVSLLSKTMGGNTLAATEVLTTAMNQYGVSFDNPIKAQKEMSNMMNVMSAAAKEGSSELPTIKQALENVGGQAKLSGLSFEQLNSAIQSLDKAGKKGAEGGTALRSILTQLGKSRFLPPHIVKELDRAQVKVEVLADKNVSFTEKMKMLQPVLKKDGALINALFGEYGQAASALIETAGAQEKMTKAISKTNTTQIQADAVMETTAEKLAKMQARIDDMKISFFNATGGASAFLEPISELAVTFSSFNSIFSMMKSGFSILKNQFSSASVSVDGLENKTNAAKTAFGGLKSVMAGIGWSAIASGIIYVGTQLWDVASGAREASIRMEEFNKGQQRGEKSGQKVVSTIQKEFTKKTQEIQNKETAGEINSKQALDQQKKLIENTKKDIQNRINLEITKRKELKIANESAKRNAKENPLADKYLQIQGQKSLTDISAITRGMLAETDEKIKAERVLFEELSSELGSIEAQIKGTKKKSKNTSDFIPSSSSNRSKTSNESGGQIKSINVRIENLVKSLNIQTTNLSESTGKIKKAVTEALVSAVKDFEISL